MRRNLAIALLGLSAHVGAEDALRFKQPEIPLWTGTAPGSETQAAPEKWNPSTDGFHRLTNVHKPSMFVFLPPKGKGNGSAVVISPGGGHRYHTMDLEGSLVAEKLNTMGIAAFVLKSRLSRAEGSTYKTEVHSLQDAQRAIRIVRQRANEWGVDATKVGIMGFSAGGEIAALAATRFAEATRSDSDGVDVLSARPDFAVLVYGGLRGANFTIPKDSPPTFLVVANDDRPAEAVAEYYMKLKAAGISAELHIYSKGGHGFGVTGRSPEFRKLPVSTWPDRLQEWLKDQGFLRPSAGS